METLKPATTLTEQIRLLRERGMDVDDPLARQWLASVSYYRLSGYWYVYRILDTHQETGKPSRLDNFDHGTTFADVASLYEFDRKLRTLIHDGMERIEIALRARIGELLVQTGPLSHRDPAKFRPEFEHAQWIATAERRVKRARKHSQSIEHYTKKYGDYPFWVLADALDFSDISKLYDGMLPEDQHSIAGSFGLTASTDQLSAKQKGKYYKRHPFARWCEQLTVLRNACAHHGRVWNRRLTPASTNALRTIPRLASMPEGQSDRLFGALLLMSLLIATISPGSTWPLKVRVLIETEYAPLPGRSVNELGFPDGWREVAPWSPAPS